MADTSWIDLAWADLNEHRTEESRQSPYICKHCGVPVTRYGPETFHTETTLIFCQFGGTKAEAVLREGVDESTE